MGNWWRLRGGPARLRFTDETQGGRDPPHTASETGARPRLARFGFVCAVPLEAAQLVLQALTFSLTGFPLRALPRKALGSRDPHLDDVVLERLGETVVRDAKQGQKAIRRLLFNDEDEHAGPTIGELSDALAERKAVAPLRSKG
jgi:hypothetical protein